MSDRDTFLQLLKDQGLTITAFAELCGLSRSAVQRWGAEGGPEIPQWAIMLLETRADLDACRRMLKYEDK